MKTLVLTGYNDAMAEIGDLLCPRMESYAREHNFGFHCVREYHDRMHPSFQKVEAILEAYKTYDTIIWIDSDSCITNPSINVLPECKPGLNVSQDWGHADNSFFFSMGNFVATKEALPIFEWTLPQERWWNTRMHEQQAIQEGCRGHEWVRSLVTVHPPRFLNSVAEGIVEFIDPTTGRPFHEGNPVLEPWEPGDFLCHLTGVPNEFRLLQLDRYFKTGSF